MTVKECPKNCPAKHSGALAHVLNPRCIWKVNKKRKCTLNKKKVEKSNIDISEEG